MSRSIHTTRRALARLRAQEFSSPEGRRALLAEARRDLARKRRIKVKIGEERHLPPAPLAGTPTETLPVEVLDTSSVVHHALTPDDVRSLLAALPGAATEGILRVQLCLGREYMLEKGEGEGDPLTGRPSFGCMFPGVYCGTVLGTYAPRSGAIQLFAFVYEESALARLPLPVEATRGYLRLRALTTLIHEVAHHHDRTCRVSRGRWLADRRPTVENYAERMEWQWTEEIGLPWLEARFPGEMKALVGWLAECGGLTVPLRFFAGDPRSTSRDGLQRLYVATDSAFESFVEGVAEEKEASTAPQRRLSFAWNLHYSDEYELCLRLVESVLASQPEWREALECQADTLVHLARYDEAWQVTGRVLEQQPANRSAWEVRARVLEFQSRWPELLALCDAAEATDPALANWAAEPRAIACCALERAEEMERWFAQWSAMRNPRALTYLRKQMYRRAGRPQPKGAADQA